MKMCIEIYVARHWRDFSVISPGDSGGRIRKPPGTSRER